MHDDCHLYSFSQKFCLILCLWKGIMSFRWDFLCWGEKSAHLSADVAFFVSPQCGWFNDNVNHAWLPRPSWTNTVFNLQKHCTLQTLLRRGDENVFTLLVIGCWGLYSDAKENKTFTFTTETVTGRIGFLKKIAVFFFSFPSEFSCSAVKVKGTR